MPWLTVTEYLCVTYDHGYVCHSQNPILLSSFMTYHGILNKTNMMVATSGAGTVNPSGIPA